MKAYEWRNHFFVYLSLYLNCLEHLGALGTLGESVFSQLMDAVWRERANLGVMAATETKSLLT